MCRSCELSAVLANGWHRSRIEGVHEESGIAEVTMLPGAVREPSRDDIDAVASRVGIGSRRSRRRGSVGSGATARSSPERGLDSGQEEHRGDQGASPCLPRDRGFEDRGDRAAGGGASCSQRGGHSGHGRGSRPHGEGRGRGALGSALRTPRRRGPAAQPGSRSRLVAHATGDPTRHAASDSTGDTASATSAHHRSRARDDRVVRHRSRRPRPRSPARSKELTLLLAVRRV